MLLIRLAARSLVVALVLIAPVAQAECAKATVMRPCRPAARRSHALANAHSQPPRVASPGLVVGGTFVAAVGVLGFGLALVAGRPCTSESCDPAPPYFYGGIVTGVLGTTVGGVMIYYGAFQTTQPVTRLPWTLPAAQSMSLRFRF